MAQAKPKASSFRAGRSKDPESSLYKFRTYRIIRCAHPSGRPLGVQRAMRFFVPPLREWRSYWTFELK